SHGPRFPNWYCRCVVSLNLSSWSMRKGRPLWPTVTPKPPICGGKKRADTLENTNCAVRPWKLGTLTRPANPGILELCHSMGKVIGVSPSTLKSYPLWVYFQMYSPENTRYFPKACCIPAWNSFRQPGLNATGTQGTNAAITAKLQPVAESTRFSLNGVSNTL